MPVQIVSATARRTWSWCQRYRPSPKAFGQQLRMCSKDPLFWQSWQAGDWDLIGPEESTQDSMLIYPGLEFSDMATVESQELKSSLVAWCTAVSLRMLMKVLPRLLTGFSVGDGIWVPPTEKLNWLVTLPFLRTRDLDFAGLKLTLSHVMSRSSP